MSNDEKDKFIFNKHSDASNKTPKQHRCNSHLEDVLEGLSQWPLNVSEPFSLFLACLRSQPGQEPPRYQELDRKKN
ncbi:uncharacterized protein BX663DRAFT_493630 [Cokeromyces recurvatus]|uniref:uncharacterized protein n=1 Tax=Cokeromyces recurvatus TaxID=90255 RepID=UPI00221E8E80|nr:uncharacterized protein BX663DRAFT_493630 [Cokeromyces recurvatus]KAI7908273.1 hypothetical protein BX663DRAFT_493630 [Cokeromyces recurvatus]